MERMFSKNSSYKIIRIADKPVEALSFDTYYNFELRPFDVIEMTDDLNLYEVLLNNKQVDAIVIQSDHPENYHNLIKLPLYYQRRCLYYKESTNVGIDVALKINSMHLSHSCDPLVSIITPLYNTNKEYFLRAYKSLCNQLLNDWEWVLVDDSPQVNEDLVSLIISFKDIRVKYYRINPTNGNIGLSKWRANCLSTGRWLLEFDHDDKLTYWCLATLKQAIDAYPDNKFVFSDCATIDGNDRPNGPLYGKEFGMGFGYPYWSRTPDGNEILTDKTPYVNNSSIRHIVGVPNHFRCWERDFYFSIGGHNQHTRIADDYELLVRTFLNTRMTRIPVCCYLQRFDGNNSQDSGNNRSDIQRRVRLISIFYDEAIHNRLIELGSPDDKWIKGYAYETGLKYLGDKSLPELDDTFYPSWYADRPWEDLSV